MFRWFQFSVSIFAFGFNFRFQRVWMMMMMDMDEMMMDGRREGESSARGDGTRGRRARVDAR